MSTPRPKVRLGRPQKPSKRSDQVMRREVEVNPTITDKEISVLHPGLFANVFEISIQRRLQIKLGLPSCQAAKKPLLTQKIKKSRPYFCRKYEDWTEK